VVSAEGEQLGIMPIQEALEAARSRDFDLVEVAPEATPPVCRIMDFGKYKYTQARRQKEARKKQTTILVKEVKMGPKTEKHDFDFKVNHVGRFLEGGHKAKVTVRFKGSMGDEDVPRVMSAAACDPMRGGWYYDVDPARATPTRIVACPATCRRFQGDQNGRVELVVGCQAIK